MSKIELPDYLKKFLIKIKTEASLETYGRQNNKKAIKNSDLQDERQLNDSSEKQENTDSEESEEDTESQENQRDREEHQKCREEDEKDKEEDEKDKEEEQKGREEDQKDREEDQKDIEEDQKDREEDQKDIEEDQKDKELREVQEDVKSCEDQKDMKLQENHEDEELQKKQAYDLNQNQNVNLQVLQNSPENYIKENITFDDDVKCENQAISAIEKNHQTSDLLKSDDLVEVIEHNEENEENESCQNVQKKQDTEERHNIKEKQDTEEEQITKEEQNIEEKQDTEEEHNTEEEQNIEERQNIKEDQVIEENQVVEEKQDTEEEQITEEEQNTEEKQVIEERQDNEETQFNKEKQNIEDSNQNSKNDQNEGLTEIVALRNEELILKSDTYSNNVLFKQIVLYNVFISLKHLMSFLNDFYFILQIKKPENIGKNSLFSEKTKTITENKELRKMDFADDDIDLTEDTKKTEGQNINNNKSNETKDPEILRSHGGSSKELSHSKQHSSNEHSSEEHSSEEYSSKEHSDVTNLSKKMKIIESQVEKLNNITYDLENVKKQLSSHQEAVKNLSLLSEKLEKSTQEQKKTLEALLQEQLGKKEETKNKIEELRQTHEKLLEHFQIRVNKTIEDLFEKIEYQRKAQTQKISEALKTFEDELYTRQDNFENSITEKLKETKQEIENERSNFTETLSNLNEKFQGLQQSMIKNLESFNEVIKELKNNINGINQKLEDIEEINEKNVCMVKPSEKNISPENLNSNSQSNVSRTVTNNTNRQPISSNVQEEITGVNSQEIKTQKVYKQTYSEVIQNPPTNEKSNHEKGLPQEKIQKILRVVRIERDKKKVLILRRKSQQNQSITN